LFLVESLFQVEVYCFTIATGPCIGAGEKHNKPEFLPHESVSLD